MAEIALHMLASGMSLAYGGDFREHGFTKLLFELLGRYQNHPRHSSKIAITNYLAWPVHIQMTPKQLDTFCSEHKATACLVFLTQDGKRLAQEQRSKLSNS